MKKKLVIAIAALAILATVPVFANRSQAINNLQVLLERVQEYGYKLSDYNGGGEGNAWWCWFMNPRHYVQVDRTFYSGNDYILVAAGDNGATDVDIEVYDENWNLIAKDADSSGVAVVKFSPRWDGMFHIRTIYYSGTYEAHVGFFIGFK